MAFRTSTRCKKRKLAIEDERTQLELAISAIRAGIDPQGFEIRYIDENIGYGVFSSRDFKEGEFLIEYWGELITYKEAKAREIQYKKKNLGCYMYFLKHNGKMLCVDATYQENTGRMVNDASPGSLLQNANIKILVDNREPHICLFAKREIKNGEEIRYDYGDKNLPWRKETQQKVKKGIAKKSKKKETKTEPGANGYEESVDVDTTIADVENDVERISDESRTADTETKTEHCANGYEESGCVDTTKDDVENYVERISDESRAADTETKTGINSDAECGDVYTTKTDVQNDVERILSYLYRAADTETKKVSDTGGDEESEYEYTTSVDVENDVERISDESRAEVTEANTVSDRIGDEESKNKCNTSVDVENDVERISRAADTGTKTVPGTNGNEESGDVYTTNSDVENDVKRIPDADTETTTTVSCTKGFKENEDDYTTSADFEYYASRISDEYRAVDIETKTVPGSNGNEESGDVDTTNDDVENEVERISDESRAADKETKTVPGKNGDEENGDVDTNIADEENDVERISEESRAADTETKTVPGTNGNEESGDVDTTNDDVENEVERISDESRAADKEIKTVPSKNGDEENGNVDTNIADEENDVERISEESRTADTETKTVPGTNGNEESGDVDTTNDDVENEVERISDESRAADKETKTVPGKNGDEENGDVDTNIADEENDVERISEESRAADTETKTVPGTNGNEESGDVDTTNDDVENEVERISDKSRAADKEIKTVPGKNGDEENGNVDTNIADEENDVERISEESRTADTETKTVPGTNGNEESGDVDTTNDDVENEVERISDESRAADKGTKTVPGKNGDEENGDVDTNIADVENDVERISEESRTAYTDEHFWGSVAVIKKGVPFGVYPMRSKRLAIGSATSNDIIVRKAASREIMLEVNLFGEVFSTNGVTNKVKHVQDKELFRVGGGEFQWFYPVPEETKTVPVPNGDEESGDVSTSNDDVENDVERISDESIASDTVSVKVGVDHKKISTTSKKRMLKYDSDDSIDDPNDSDYNPYESITESEADADEYEDIDTSENTPTASAPVAESEQAHDIGITRHAVTAYRKQVANVTIPIYSKKADGSRDYRKINACLYCERLFTSKIAPHYENIHTDKDAVKKVKLMPPDSEKRKKALLELEHKGNFQHNAKVIENGSGELIVARRPNEAYKDRYRADDFIPCEYCLAFYLKTSLWLHVRTCPFKPTNEQPSANYINNGLTIVSPFVPTLPEEEAELEKLFLGMKETAANPGIPKICESDQLIREFGRSLLGRLGEEDEQRLKDVDNVRTKLRTVGRLLNVLRNVEGEEKTVSDFIKGTAFKKVVSATKSLALECDSPQLALTLGHYVKQIAFLKVSCGIINGSSECQQEGKDFQYLYEAHWNNQVSCVAKRRQKLRQINKTSEIPSTADLIKLTTWIKLEIERIIKIDSPSSNEWKWAAQLIMARVILFNKRRVAEVMEMKVTDFLRLQQQKEDDTDDDIYRSLDISEQALSKRMKVMEIRGKSTREIRKVYVILTPDMYNALEYLIRKRKHNSPFLFGRKSKSTPLDGCEAMRSITDKCPDLKKPKLIRTRLLRKYLATTSQILDMTNTELKLVADHMGHSVNIHTDIYRLQSSVLEKTKVARVLIALENGQINRFKGRNLESISVSDLPQPIAYEDSWTPGSSNEVQVPNRETDDDEESVLPRTLEGNHADSRKRRNSDLETEEGNHGDACKRRNIDVETEDGIQCDSNQRRNTDIEDEEGAADMPKIKRVRWTDTESGLFMDAFRTYIAQRKMPPSQAIHAMSKKLPNRTIAQIRTRIHNIITGKLKKF